MTYRNLAVVMVAAALLGSALAAEARPRRERWMARRPDLAEALDLTAEQQERLKTLRTEGQKTMTRLGADLKVAGMDLRALMAEVGPNVADVKARVAAVNRIRSQIFSEGIEGRLAHAAILTPEQKEKMKELRPGRGMGKGRAIKGRGRGMRGRGHAMKHGGRRGPGRGRAMAMRGRGPARGSGMRRPNLANALGLSESQQEKLKALGLSNAKTMARLQADQKIAMLDLRSAMGQASPSKTDVKTLVAEVNRARGQILTARIDQQLARAAVFTPEQKEKMKELRKEGKGHRGRGMMQRGHRMMRDGRRMMGRPHMQPGECPMGVECPECPRCLPGRSSEDAPAEPKQ